MDGLLGKIADNALDSIHESKSAKRELKNDLKREKKLSEQELESQRKQAELDKELEFSQMEHERQLQENEDITEKLKDIENSFHETNFMITDKDGIISGLSSLSTLLINLKGIDTDSLEEGSGIDSLRVKKYSLINAINKKIASGVEMLETIDPSNPTLIYFKKQNKKSLGSSIKSMSNEKKATWGLVIFFVITLLFIFICAL